MNFIDWVMENKLRVLDGYRKQCKYSMLPIVRITRYEPLRIGQNYSFHPIVTYEVNSAQYRKELTSSGRRRHNLEELETLSQNLEKWVQSFLYG